MIHRIPEDARWHLTGHPEACTCFPEIKEAQLRDGTRTWVTDHRRFSLLPKVQWPTGYKP